MELEVYRRSFFYALKIGDIELLENILSLQVIDLNETPSVPKSEPCRKSTHFLLLLIDKLNFVHWQNDIEVTLKCTELLLRAGADPNATTGNRENPTIFSYIFNSKHILSQCSEIVKMFIENGADIYYHHKFPQSLNPLCRVLYFYEYSQKCVDAETINDFLNVAFVLFSYGIDITNDVKKLMYENTSLCNLWSKFFIVYFFEIHGIFVTL